jgi:methyl-accepting chemotaxis protein
MKNVSGIKISHKISSLMIGLIVGFVLMGVAYYAQISVDIKQERTRQQFQQAEQSLDLARQAHTTLKTQLLTMMQSGEVQGSQDLLTAAERVQQAQEALGKINFQFYSSAAQERIETANQVFAETVEQTIPALAQTEAAESDVNMPLPEMAGQLRNLLQNHPSAMNIVLQTELHYSEFLRTRDGRYAAAFQAAVADLRDTIGQLDMSATAAQRALNLTDNYATGFEAMIERRATAAEREQMVEEASLGVIGALETYRTSMGENLQRRIDAAEGERTVAQWMFAIVLFMTAIGTTLGLFLIYRSIVLPLWHMQSIIAQQNRGNDKARVNITANDELGNLGRAFNRLLDERIQVLAEKFQENETLNNSIIGLIRALGLIARKDLSIKVPVSADVTGTVSDAVNLLTSETARTLHQVRAASEKINAISDQLQAQSGAVMVVAEDERTQVAETVAALEQSAKTMSDIAKEARVANSIASTAIDSTVKAQSSVTETVEGIQTIRSTISETEKRIKRLGDRSQEITSIVNLINTIAERTHILALNASMHAASAGEAGKGFAVVAEEVQRLAENARGATSEISAMVNNIRVETSDTVNIMNKLITQVAEGTKLAEDSGQRMHETEAATRQLVNHVKSIAVNSVNQANMASRVRDRATQITESTQKTYSELEQQRLQTDELKVHARSLLERVNVFTLPEFRAEAHNTLVSIRQPAVNEEQMEKNIANA